jgi:hypothetical protein
MVLVGGSVSCHRSAGEAVSAAFFEVDNARDHATAPGHISDTSHPMPLIKITGDSIISSNGQVQIPRPTSPSTALWQGNHGGSLLFTKPHTAGLVQDNPSSAFQTLTFDSPCIISFLSLGCCCLAGLLVLFSLYTLLYAILRLIPHQ